MYYLTQDGRELCEAISEIIYDYRNGQIDPCDVDHVGRWASQFEFLEQELILRETLHILGQGYLNEERFYKYIDDVFDKYPLSFWEEVCLLDVQQQGNSQRHLNSMLLRKHPFIGNDEYINPREFIYLDDFIFSGNRLLSDLTSWIADYSPDYPFTINIFLMGYYEYGHYFVKKKLNEIAAAHRKSINFRFRSYESLRYENRFYYRNNAQVCWPTDSVLQNPDALNYINSLDPQFSFRVHTNAEIEPFNSNRRVAYENVLIKYGLKIMGFSISNTPVIRPLGYSTFKNFGFGSMVFTYRNCPNNSPLVFWWGDPSRPPSHPFSKWYPLLPRSTYGGV